MYAVLRKWQRVYIGALNGESGWLVLFRCRLVDDGGEMRAEARLWSCAISGRTKNVVSGNRYVLLFVFVGGYALAESLEWL